MLKRILVALFAFILISLIVIWIISGGPRKVITDVRASVSSALTPGETSFRLPWQPAELFPDLDITELMDISMDGEAMFPEENDQSAYDRLRALEAEYDRLRGEANRRSMGPPSPYAGKIGFSQTSSLGVSATDPREESVQLIANYANGESIDIASWTLQSALSGSSVQIPPAAAPLRSGGPNSLGAVTLEAGASAIISSGPSPVGLSFRENMCTGYLGQFQSFEPPLYEACPSPSSMAPLSEQNLQRYGSECFDVVSYLPSCRFPQSFPENTSEACRAFLTDVLSYNGCVRDNSFRPDFQGDTWRLYVGSGSELWRNSHDAIRLLDAEGRTVSVFVY